MFPAILDLSVLNLAVVGNGPAAARRLSLLYEAGADSPIIFSPFPDPSLRTAARSRLVRRLPSEDEIAAFHLVFTADLPEADARRIAGWARAHGTLINTEDVRPLCDFHVPSIVRRGDLLLTVSTGGKSPGLARRLRRKLESFFGPEWGPRLEEISMARNAWRADDVPSKELGRRTDSLIARKGWL